MQIESHSRRLKNLAGNIAYSSPVTLPIGQSRIWGKCLGQYASQFFSGYLSEASARTLETEFSESLGSLLLKQWIKWGYTTASLLGSSTRA